MKELIKYLYDGDKLSLPNNPAVFQMMEDDMVANGRIPRWKFKAYFLPEVIVAIYRGLTMAQEDYYNKCRMATNLIGARAAHRIDSNQDASNSSSHYN